MALNGTNSTGCGQITSAACVLWQGPDIECIDGICKGASIQDIVYEIGSLICNITELSSYDLLPLALPEEELPGDFIELMQIIINRSSFNPETLLLPETRNATVGEIIDGCCDTPYIVPPLCICKKNTTGDISLPCDPVTVKEYIDLIADRVCINASRAKIDMDKMKSDIFTNNNTSTAQFKVVNNEISGLKQEMAIIKEYKVYSKCITAGSKPVGSQVPIQRAVEDIEANVCGRIAVLGSNDIVDKVKSYQCATLSDKQSCENNKIAMNQLPGWISEPDNMAESMMNLWVAFCDLRQCVDNQIASTMNPVCLPLPLAKLTINSRSDGYFIICFEAQKYPMAKEPIGYRMEVYPTDQKTGVVLNPGFPIYQTNHAKDGTFVINTVPVPGASDRFQQEVIGGEKYSVQVTPVYDDPSKECMAATSTVIDFIKNCEIMFKFRVYATSLPVSTEVVDCGGKPYTEENAKFKVRLYNKYNSHVINNTTEDLNITVEIRVSLEGELDYTYEQYNVVIPIGSSESNEITYKMKEVNTTNCKMITRGESGYALKIHNQTDCQYSFRVTSWNNDSYYLPVIGNCNSTNAS